MAHNIHPAAVVEGEGFKALLNFIEPGYKVPNLVAHNIHPAAVVEGEGFKALLNFIEPGYKVPTSTHIAKIILPVHILPK